jgi:phosphoglycerol transferase
MPDYSHLACHVYTRTLRWSYGTNRNRRWDEWHRYVAGLPAPEMVRALCLAGFSGVYVDRRGFVDDGESVVAELRALLGREVVSSGPGEQLLFSLNTATEALRATTSDADWERAKNRLLTRPCVLCQDGFYPWAPTDPPEPRRAMHRATLRLVNPGTEPRQVTLRITWKQHARVDVHVHGPDLGVDSRVSPPAEPARWAIDIVLPPGEHLLHFDAAPKPVGLARMYCAWIATDVRLEVQD